MADFMVPLIIRGRVIESEDAVFGGRGAAASFATPDVKNHLTDLALVRPSALSDLYSLSFEDILDYLEALGKNLALSRNAHLKEALKLSIKTSGLSEPILVHCYETLGGFFDRRLLRQMADSTVGISHLEGWVEQDIGNGCRASIRAFGTRSVHIVAGNVPGVSALTIARNAIIRGDAIIKTPSNDPLTAAAIARTMVEMAPDHPITKHLSVAYWKGGDAAFEERLYQPKNIEKIVAWGGLASISHISKYLQPGIDLITLDPKLSSTIIGREALKDDAVMRAVAQRAALDVGVYNQEGCLNARVIYLESGTHEDGLKKANRFGQMLLDEIHALPPHFSGPAVRMDSSLAEEIEALRLGSEWHKVLGGGNAGAVIISQTDEPVDFARLLANRVANIVPVDDLEIPVRAVTAYTQTIGVYPEALKFKLRDRLAMHGAQRVVSLGGAGAPIFAGPQDGIEPMRRMCKWVIEESHDAGNMVQNMLAAE